MKNLMNKIILPQILKTRDEGQKEYAQDDNNVFANFERVSKKLGISKEEVLMTYLLKHVDGITAWVNGHKSQREDVTGRIKDAIVYLMLLWAMTDTEECNKCGMHRQGCTCKFVSNHTKYIGYEK